MRNFVACLALLTVAGASQAQITHKGDIYYFKVNFTKGQVFTLKILSEIPMAGQKKPMSVDANTTTTVLDKKGDIATLSIATSGALFPQKNVKPNVVKVTSQGKVVGGSTLSIQGVLVPPGPIKVGQSWRSANGIGSPLGTGNAEATYTFKGLKNVGGQSVAVIDVKMKVKGGFSMSMSGTTLLSPKDGLILKSNLTANTQLTKENGGQSMQMNVSVKRI